MAEESTLSSREKLHELEATGKFVFHGSPVGGMAQLDPRQGIHVPDIKKLTEVIKDGNSAVSATPYVDIAIFRALINKKNIKLDYSSGFEVIDGRESFMVSSELVLEQAKDKIGYVYVFVKEEFEPFDRNGNPRVSSMEWRSYKSVKPIEIIQVNFTDLPDQKKIEILKA